MLTRTRISALALLALSPLVACGPDTSNPAKDSASASPSTSSKPATTTAPHASASATPSASASSNVIEAQTPAGPRPSDADLKELTKANNSLAFALWNKVAKPGHDAAFSPFSIESALTMTWLGAKGDTASQMKKVLGFEGDASKAADVTGRYQKSLGGPVTINVANRLFGEKSFTFDSAFLGATDKTFGAALEPLDFVGATDPSRTHINQWVADQTKDRIKDLIPAGGVTPETKLVLVNAIYFLGDWASPFTKEATRPAAFHTSATAQHDVPMMNQHLGAAFGENDDVTVIDLPYQGQGFSMTFVLPKKIDGLDAVEKKLSAETFDKWIGSEKQVEVAVSVPKFTIDPGDPVRLGDALKGLGMSDAFDSKKADFTAIANPPKPEDRLFIGEVFHKAFVKVDEKGTEAAAATAVSMKAGAAAPAAPPKEFVADHPFLFFLRDAKSGTILFAGRVADPVAK